MKKKPERRRPPGILAAGSRRSIHGRAVEAGRAAGHRDHRGVERYWAGDGARRGREGGKVSDKDNHRLFQTNFWGVVYGSQIAAVHLKNRGGAIVNVGSVAGDVALPMQGMYCASKSAVKGFTDARRPG